MLQPLFEISLSGKDISERGIGAGLSSAESGLRLRYEIRREFAPYVGAVWHREFGGNRRLLTRYRARHRRLEACGRCPHVVPSIDSRR